MRTFETIEELRKALHEWLAVYNEQWLVERHGHRSPAQVPRDFLALDEAARLSSIHCPGNRGRYTKHKMRTTLTSLDDQAVNA